MKKPERSEGRGPSRREIIALGVGVFVVAAVPFARGRRQLVRRTVPMMGTIAEFAVLHRDRFYAHGAIDAAIARLRQMERVMTRFSAASDVGRANRSPDEYRAELQRQGCPEIGVLANVKRQYARIEMQAALRESIAWWAGYQRAAGRSDSESYRRFFHRFGVDVLGAQALARTEALELANRINTYLGGAG